MIPITRKKNRKGRYIEWNGSKWVTVQDVGCEDFICAKANRNRIEASRTDIDYWTLVDHALMGVPFGSKLPKWIPTDEPYALSLPPVLIEHRVSQERWFDEVNRVHNTSDSEIDLEILLDKQSLGVL